MIHIYGHPMSTCTRKVLFTMHENGTPHEFHLVDFAKGEHKQDAHMKRQPFGQVPALEDNGLELYESRAMMRYLDETAGHKLTPATAADRARMEQWISVETENFKPHAMKFIYHNIFKREQSAETLEAATKGLEAACAVLDKHLTGKTFLVGDKLSLADITYAPYIDYAMATPAKETMSKYPHFMSWWGRVSERPGWMKATGR
jgi:glutathione S-transferase